MVDLLVQLLLVVEMVMEGRMELRERRTRFKRNKYQIIRHKKQRFMLCYSRDSNREIHGEKVDDAHTLAIILVFVRPKSSEGDKYTMPLFFKSHDVVV